MIDISMERALAFEKILKNADITIDSSQRARIWSLVEQNWKVRFASNLKRRSFWKVWFVGLVTISLLLLVLVGTSIFFIKINSVDHVLNNLDKEIENLETEVAEWDVGYDADVEGYVFSE